MKIKKSPTSRFKIQSQEYSGATFAAQDRVPQRATGTIARLSIAWITVALFLLFGGSWLGGQTPVWQAGGLFLWLFGVIMWCSFGCVKEADSLANLLGEPLGSLVLALAIITIEDPAS